MNMTLKFTSLGAAVLLASASSAMACGSGRIEVKSGGIERCLTLAQFNQLPPAEQATADRHDLAEARNGGSDDGIGHDAGDDHGNHSASHDAGDDHGGDSGNRGNGKSASSSGGGNSGRGGGNSGSSSNSGSGHGGSGGNSGSGNSGSGD